MPCLDMCMLLRCVVCRFFGVPKVAWPPDPSLERMGGSGLRARGAVAAILLLLTEGPSGTAIQLTCVFPKVPGRTLFSLSVERHYFGRSLYEIFAEIQNVLSPCWADADGSLADGSFAEQLQVPGKMHEAPADTAKLPTKILRFWSLSQRGS